MPLGFQEILWLLAFGFLILLILWSSTRMRLRSLEMKLQALNSALVAALNRLQDLEATVDTFHRGKPLEAKSGRSRKAKTGKKRVNSVGRARTAPAEPSTVQASTATPTIVTRTSKTTSGTLDTWTHEKPWLETELNDLNELFESGLGVSQIASRLRVDSKDVAYALARHRFGCRGNLEDLKSAPNDGRRWNAEDRRALEEALNSGKSIQDIAHNLGRTQIAIVWQATDLGLGS